MVITCDGGGRRDDGGGRISATGRRKRGRGEGREEDRAREERRANATRERSLPLPHLDRESPVRARVLVVTKSVDPDTVYRPRLSRTLACRSFVPAYSASPTYSYLANSWGGCCCAPLSRGRPILRAGGASPTWNEGSLDPEVVNRANQLDRCQSWRADRAGESLHVLSTCLAVLQPVRLSRVPPRSLEGFSKPEGVVVGPQMRRGGDSIARQGSTTWLQVPVEIGSGLRPGWLTFSR